MSKQNSFVNPKFMNLNKRLMSPKRQDEESVSDLSDDPEITENDGKFV